MLNQFLINLNNFSIMSVSYNNIIFFSWIHLHNISNVCYCVKWMNLIAMSCFHVIDIEISRKISLSENIWWSYYYSFHEYDYYAQDCCYCYWLFCDFVVEGNFQMFWTNYSMLWTVFRWIRPNFGQHKVVSILRSYRSQYLNVPRQFSATWTQFRWLEIEWLLKFIYVMNILIHFCSTDS